MTSAMRRKRYPRADYPGKGKMKIEIQIMILGMKIVARRIECIPNGYRRHSIYGVKCLVKQANP
jgi:hypothetical protein